MSSDTLLLMALVPVVVASAIADLRHLRIPNTHVLIALGLFVLAGPLTLSWAELSPRLLVAGIAFALCFVLFAAGVIGGGDAKMMPVILLFIPSTGLVDFLRVFSIALGAVSLGALVVQRVPYFRRLGWKSAQAQRHVPVGVAMAIAVTLAAIASAVGG